MTATARRRGAPDLQAFIAKKDDPPRKGSFAHLTQQRADIAAVGTALAEKVRFVQTWDALWEITSDAAHLLSNFCDGMPDSGPHARRQGASDPHE